MSKLHFRMKKIFYFIAFAVLAFGASSCSKQCVQCTAKDKYGVVINTSNVVCEYDFNRKHFISRYEDQFQGYVTACAEVQQ